MITVKAKRNGHVKAERPKLAAVAPPVAGPRRTVDVSDEELAALGDILPGGKGKDAGTRHGDTETRGHGDAENGTASPRRSVSASSAASEETLNDSGGTYLIVARSQIEPDPDQPRKQFDQAELKQLAASLQADGQLVPLIVNVIHGNLGKPRYRIIEGERRWRAAAIAGLSEMKVIARDLDQPTVVRLQGIANLQREDLNAIEQAEWCRRMTQPAGEGGGLTQQQLADRLGVTQAEISNRIRVLRVPPWARELVISGQMSRKHALALLAYEGYKPILDKVRDWTLDKLNDDGDLGAASEYEGFVEGAANQTTHAISGCDYAYPHGWVDYQIELTDDLRKKLQIVEIDRGDGQKDERALNVKLARKLLLEAKGATVKEAEKKADKRAAKAERKNVEQSPAEKRRKEEQQRRQFNTRLSNWYHDWLRVLLAGAKPLPHFDALGWLAVWALFARTDHTGDAQEVLCELLQEKPRQFGWDSGANLVKLLQDLPAWKLKDVTTGYGRRLLVQAEGQPRGMTGGVNSVVPDRVIVPVSRMAAIDVAAEWRDDRDSSMREKFWQLHNKEQLLALGKELNVPLQETAKKSQMVQILLGQQRPLAMPRELQAFTRTTKSTKGTTGKKAAKST